MLNLGILIGVGSVAVGAIIVEKILIKAGKYDEAAMVALMNTAMVAGTAVGYVTKAFGALKGLA